MSDYNPRSISQSWQPFTLKDAYQPRLPLRFLAGRLFELPSLNVLFGAPGSLKSFLLADLSICVASGTEWLPPRGNGASAGLPVTQGNVVWLDFDNGKRRTHDRFSALGKALNLPSDTPLFYYSMPTPWFDASNKPHVEEVAKVINRHRAIFVTIDNLGVISGGADENTGAMIVVLSNLRWLVESTEAVICVVHHRRKSNGKTGRKGDALRGHSSIEAALDLALLVDREEGSDTIKVQPTKERGANVSPFSATFTYLDDINNQLLEARFFADAGAGSVASAERMRVIYACAGDEPQNKTTLSQKSYKAGNGKYGKNLLSKDIDLMIQQGYLVMTSGKNNAQLLTQNPNKQP